MERFRPKNPKKVGIAISLSGKGLRHFRRKIARRPPRHRSPEPTRPRPAEPQIRGKAEDLPGNARGRGSTETAVLEKT